MNYDVLLVTRNRVSALQLSLPLMLGQSRLPRQFIVVDSSDNHPEVARTISGIFSQSNANVPLKFLQSSPGTSLQRNIGLDHATSEVLLYPDDDSLWYPAYAESIMSIYEKDTDQLVGAVAGRQVNSPPAVLSQPTLPYTIELRDRVSRRLQPLSGLAPFNFLKDPIFLEGRQKSAGKRTPNWLAREDAEVSGPMTGCSMSFRAQALSGFRFDEFLGRYSLFEDRDASLWVMNERLIVTARRAQMFHYRSPEKRTNGFEWGMMHILNRAYVVCKWSAPGSEARRNIRPYSFYKCFRYLLQGHTRYGRQRLRGALAATRRLSPVINAAPDELAKCFVAAREQCLALASTA